MNKKNIIAIIVALGVVIVLLLISVFSNNNPTEAQNNGQTIKTQEGSSDSSVKIVADKIEVVHFHATQQCISCTTVGKYALKTIEEKFPEEYKSGKIVFKDINGELPENKEIVMKYQASGSSLFVNAITAGKDNISEDVDVWRLISDEAKFTSYFQDKLNKLLGK